MNLTRPTPVVAGRFSVIIPSYQHGAFLERTLNSILSQDCPDVEVHVQDGGSTDQTLEILRRHGDRIRWVSERDHGQAAAINSGLCRATGEYLCYLNSDDVLQPGALRKVRDYFVMHPAALVVYGLADFIDEADRVLGAYPVESWDYARLRETCFICQPACFWRRTVLDRFGGFDESLHYAMDYEYWLRIGATTPFHFLPEILASSRCHLAAKTFSRNLAAQREALTVLQRYHAGRIPPQWIITYARLCGEDQLLVGGPAGWRWLRFATSYWLNLLRWAPKVTRHGSAHLWRRSSPPYPSACRRLQDPLRYLQDDLAIPRAERIETKLAQS